MNGCLRATLTVKNSGTLYQHGPGQFCGLRRRLTGHACIHVSCARAPRDQESLRRPAEEENRRYVFPQWLEWLLALIVGFLVMEAVRYWFNHRKYAALLSALRREARGTESGRPPTRSTRSGRAERF